MSGKVELVLTPAQEQLEQTLRTWRTAEAAKTGKPAFLILSDATLRAVAQSTPQSLTQLQQISGIGPDKAERFGPTIIALCSGTEVPGDFGAPTAKPRIPKPAPKSPVPHSSAASPRMSGNPEPKPAPKFPVPHSSAASPRMSGNPEPKPAPKSPVPHSSAASSRMSGNPEPKPAPKLPVPHSSAASSRMSGSPQPKPALFASAQTPIPIVRPAHTPEPTGESFTPDQQALELRLRDWRKSESEKMGLPQFFVLGTTALRSIVLTRPRTLAQLQSIHGIGPDKIDRFGPSILAVCNT